MRQRIFYGLGDRAGPGWPPVALAVFRATGRGRAWNSAQHHAGRL